MLDVPCRYRTQLAGVELNGGREEALRRWTVHGKRDGSAYPPPMPLTFRYFSPAPNERFGVGCDGTSPGQ